ATGSRARFVDGARRAIERPDDPDLRHFNNGGPACMLALPPDTEYAMRLVRLAVLLGMIAFLSGPAWSGEPASARALRKVDALLVADREHAAAAAKTDMLTGVSAQFADSVVMPAGSKGLAEGRDAVI